MSNPLDLKQFEHFLNFKSDDTGLLQISEPLKFDASEFVITQDDKGYARDISFMAKEVSLEFYEGFFEPTEAYQLNSGIVVDKASMGLENILRYNKDYGFQSEIEYILRRNGVDFILGELNFEGCETDELTYFKCKVIQATKRALARRREDTEIDVFSDEDLDGNYIEPLATQNLLLQAKPIVQQSEFIAPNQTTSFEIQGTRTYFYPVFRIPLSDGIQDASSSLFSFYDPNFGQEAEAIEGCVKINARNDLTDVSISVTNLDVDINLGLSTNDDEFAQIVVDYGTGFNSGQFTRNIAYTQTNPSQSTSFSINNLDLDFNINGVPNDGFISVYLKVFFGTAGNRDVSVRVNEGSLKIKATATSIDTVVKAVKYIDLAKQSLKAINGMGLTSTEFESGGQFDNLYALSGNLIRQRDDVPFYTNFKDRKENLVVMNSDIQINSEDAFVLKYDKFYDNVENGFFSIDPSSESVMAYNSKYAVNLLEWKYKDYEKDRDEENTLDAVHTEAQFSINNTRVKNTKKIDVADIYDPFRIESQRKQAFKETTALDGDDKIHVLDTTNIAPGTKKGFSASIRHLVTQNDDGETVVKLLKNAELPSWALLGFNVGSPFEIINTQNSGTYTVFEIENTILTLTPVTPPNQSFSGEVYTTVEYPLENVLLTNRTNEGFTLIDNLLNPDNFSNLRYTIRRNLIHWEPYISTCANYISDNPKNTKFVNNGLLVTQFEDGETYTEDGDIDLSTIQSAILTPKTYDVTIKAGYDDVLDLISKYEDIATAGGFVRCKFVDGSIKKLYPSKLGYTWATESLNILGEERFEGDIVTVNRVDGIIEINNVGYPQISTESLFYENSGEYFSILDENKEKIINFTKYNKFVVQEETFDNVNDLAQALIDL